MASNTITIICAVAAEFKNGMDKFYVTRDKLGLVLQAPEWIKNTLMFKLLAADGSLKYVTPANRIQVENEPFLGLNAEGKAEVKEEEPAKEKEEPVVAPVVEAVVEPVAEEAVVEQPKKSTRGRKTATTQQAE